MKKAPNIRILVFAGISFAAFLAGTFFMYRLAGTFAEQEKEEKTVEEIRKNYVTPAEPDGPEPEAEENDGNDKAERVCPVSVDIPKLRAINGDVIGWLYGEDTKVDYPVLQAGDDVFYLTHDIYRQESIAGCVFASCSSFPDFTDTHTVLFGHRMTNGTMFGSLGLWQEQEYFDSHPFVLVTGAGEAYELVPVAILETPYNSPVYTADFGEGRCREWVEWLKSGSFTESAYIYEPGDRFVSFSTCSRSSTDIRLVLTCVMIPY